ncbi:MAG: PHP domain-containing protein [Chloroflexi bacterium]|nr:PHP domain-containing protein [Chloroflexota bacterium]
MYRDGKLRLDLHTHIDEATGYGVPTEEIVREVIDLARTRGLDGIAVTSHNKPSYGVRFRELAQALFGDSFLIIPGQEKDEVSPRRQVIELYLPTGAVFRILAHPGQPSGNLDGDLSDLHGVELQNALHDWHIARTQVEEMAARWDLLPVQVSDAHTLDSLGHYHTLVSLEEMTLRVLGRGQKGPRKRS